MDIKSMIVDLQVYIHIRTGKNEVHIAYPTPRFMFAFRAAHHTATKWMASHGVMITPVLN